MNPTILADAIKSDFLRYYESPFALRSDVLKRERHKVLSRVGLIAQEPLIEFTPRYATAKETLAEIIARIMPGSLFADFVDAGLFPKNRRHMGERPLLTDAQHGRVPRRTKMSLAMTGRKRTAIVKFFACGLIWAQSNARVH